MLHLWHLAPINDLMSISIIVSPVFRIPAAADSAADTMVIAEIRTIVLSQKGNWSENTIEIPVAFRPVSVLRFPVSRILPGNIVWS